MTLRTEYEQGARVRKVEHGYVTSTAFTDAHIWDRVAIEAALEPRLKKFPVNEVFHGKPAAVVLHVLRYPEIT